MVSGKGDGGEHEGETWNKSLGVGNT